ncbi:MAG: colanic acid/amylovoran biosynthesis glycosyltransferase [Planctomycetota bacterium]|jgi:colanic acid/amylovoran biosynthesis glycosyltransferase
MRIAFFCTRFPSVSETFVLTQMAGLLDQEFEIDVHAIKPEQGGVIQPIFEEYGLEKHISYRGRIGSIPGRLVTATCLLIRFGLTSPLKLLALKKLVKTVPEISFVAALFTLRGLRSRPEADVLYAHFGPNGQAAATLKAVGLIDLPIVTVFHGFDVTTVIKKWGPDYYRCLFEHGTLMLPVSQEFKRRLIEMGCPAEKIQVHHMGVDIQSLDYRRRTLPADGSEIQVLSIARLVEKKGIADGIQAVHALTQDSKIKIKYRIVGDGVLRPELESLIEKLGCQKSVEMVGWKNQDEVKGFIEQSHIYLAPSVVAATGDEEGIPVVLMEAAASGLFVISTRHSGIPELVRDHDTGLLADEHDVEGLTTALSELCQNSELGQSLSENGRRLVENEFEIHGLNTKLGELLRGHKKS